MEWGCQELGQLLYIDAMTQTQPHLQNVRTVFWVAVAVGLAVAALVLALGPRLVRVFSHLPDQGPRWYYWKLPEATTWGRITSWTGYALHQISVWIIVVRAMKEKPHLNSVSRLNLWALGANLFFVLLHLLQTQVWYDGLAQDVPIWTSQYSVIVMLVLILFMTMRRRGLFFGKSLKAPPKAVAVVGKYHGVYIAWALVYTFWFHPMEGVYGVLIGFVYMFFLLIQLSMFNTRIHFSMPWIVFLEFFVGIHGPIIAIMNGQEVWPMFLFGFLFMFVATQMHGLKLKTWVRLAILALYVAAVLVVYSFRGYGRLFEISFIPVALYGGAVGLTGLAWLISIFVPKLRGSREALS